MPSLPDELFSLLENKTLQARETAEKAARNIIAYFKVESGAWWGDKDDPQRNLWLGLRARARQLGYAVEDEGEKDPVKRGLLQLVEEIAYEQWHRMLFARFLAENNLLMHPSGVAVSLTECEELAKEEGEDDAWRLAARYASAMLPGIFKQEDPCAQVRLTPSDHHALEAILLTIPVLVFTCDDSLGWMYQFWQSKKKDEVNASGRKISGADLSPVTQLFTEDYMVRFLLENSLGAWWAARHPESSLIKKWSYLRFREDGTSATGTFSGWPERAAEVTVMDPCCGSGHFLVAAFDMLCSMRMEEEGINADEAARKTLNDNLFGLEIDQRCTQIAYFSLSLIGWKVGGYQTLSNLNIACTGIAVKGQIDSWLALAGENSRVKAGLERLYNLFKDAPELGSLINPSDLPTAERMFVADYDEVEPIFEKALSRETNDENINMNSLGFSAENLLLSSRLLNKKYTLIITNVPYLKRAKQSEILRSYCKQYHSGAKADLATCFLERSFEFCRHKGSIAIVNPQNWLFQPAYKTFRQEQLVRNTIDTLVNLGSGAFKTIGGEVVNVSLLIGSHIKPDSNSEFSGLDLNSEKKSINKIALLKDSPFVYIRQLDQKKNPDYRIVIGKTQEGELLSNYAESLQGVSPADLPHYGRFFWELLKIDGDWKFWQSTVKENCFYGGREQILWMNRDFYFAKECGLVYVRGQKAWGKQGIVTDYLTE